MGGAAITAYEEDHSGYLNKSKKVLHVIAHYVYEQLKQLDVDMIEPEGGFYLMPDFTRMLHKKFKNSKDFCKSCNRLRITAKGDLRLCLFGNTGINIRHLMQKDDQTEELKDLILKQLNFKKESHYLELGETGLTKNLSTTGG